MGAAPTEIGLDEKKAAAACAGIRPAVYRVAVEAAAMSGDGVRADRNATGAAHVAPQARRIKHDRFRRFTMGGYDGDCEALEVELVSGAVYRYHSVDEEAFDRFLAARSKETYFNRHIGSTYPWEQMER